MSTGADPRLLIAALGALAFLTAILLSIGYGVLTFATRFLQMRRDIEELKLAVRELRQRA